MNQSNDSNYFAVAESTDSILIKQAGQYQITAQITFYGVNRTEEFVVNMKLNGSVVVKKYFSDLYYLRQSLSLLQTEAYNQLERSVLQVDFHFLTAVGGPTSVSVGSSSETLPAKVLTSECLTFLFISRLSD